MTRAVSPALLAALASAAALAGCSPVVDLPRSIGPITRGSGVATEEVRDLPPFREIEITGAIRADVRVGREQKVVLSGDDNIVPLVETIVTGDRLVVGMKTGVPASPKLTLRVDIDVADLDAAEASGASTIDVRDAASKRLRLVASGASTITAAGEATDANIEASGASTVRATDMATQVAYAEASGASRIEVAAADVLTAEASGASTICYEGSPEVDEEVSGASTVKPCP